MWAPRALHWCLWFALSLGAMLGHPAMEPKWRTVAHITITKSPVDVCSLCCLLKLCWSLWAMLSPGNLLGSMICTATGDHAEVLDTCWHQRPGGWPWSVLLLTVKDKELSFAVVSMSTGSKLRRRHRRFLWQYSPTLFPKYLTTKTRSHLWDLF